MDATPPSEPDSAAVRVDSPALEPLPPRMIPPVATPPRRAGSDGLGWRRGIALGLIAFLIGVGAAAFVIFRLVRGDEAKPVATVTLPVGTNGQAPVVIVPSKTNAPVPTIDLAALSTREAELADRIGDLEARSGAIDRDARRASGYATRSEGLMVAFAARRALDRGLNLGFLEDQLRARFGTVQPGAVATIVQAAREPVTLEDLRVGLDGVAPELMTGVASTGWWQSLRRELSNLVVVRKAGTPSPLPVDRVARARRLLDAGQVEAALAEVSRTPGAPHAERWTSAARRYIAARRALDTIESAAILAPGIDPAPEQSPPPPPTAAAPATAQPVSPSASATATPR